MGRDVECIEVEEIGKEEYGIGITAEG